MNEFGDHISFYRDVTRTDRSLSSTDEAKSIETARSYLDKYWVQGMEFASTAKPSMDQMFIPGAAFPAMIFKPQFEIWADTGGCLFLENDFVRFQRFFREAGEKCFFVIENDFNGRLKEPPLRLKYPIDITWDELNAGAFISSVIVNSAFKEFYVFGETGRCGKYAGSNLPYPLDLFGFVPAYRDVVLDAFYLSDEVRQTILSALPETYRKRMPN